MNAVFLVSTIAIMLGFLIWGLRHPGKFHWKRTRVPISPPALVGAIIFVFACALCVAVTKIHYFDDEHRRTIAIVPLVALAMSGWILAVITGQRDIRRYKEEKAKRN